MTAVQADALTVANPRRSHPYLVLVATACAMVMPLNLAGRAQPGRLGFYRARAAVTATAAGQLPVCPLHGRC